MNRRTFLRTNSILGAGFAVSKAAAALVQPPPTNDWRTFEVTTRVQLLKPAGACHIWLPAALILDTPYQRTHFNHYTAPGANATLDTEKQQALGVISAAFPPGVRPTLTLTSRISLKNYTVDLSSKSRSRSVPAVELEYFLRPSRFVPTDGVVKATALKITAGAAPGVEQAQAIYQWVVENTFRDPKVRGCGRGDIRSMLESGNLGGKCADLNALYVGLARSVGLPARHVYGLRTAKSELGFRSLGLASDEATKSQHCRAEVYLQDHGWVPVDPSDVRKVALEESPGGLALSSEPVSRARSQLFGSWEMNWMAYNYAHDVELPGSAGKPLTYFMYPQAEIAGERIDPFDPASFQYEITSKEIG